MSDKPNIILAAGGTGGHIFPALSLAEDLIKKGFKPSLITEYRFKAYNTTVKGLEINFIQAAHLKGNLLRKLLSSFVIFIGIIQVLLIFLKKRPKVVIGFGGYPSFAPLFIASLLGIKTVIHEQNSILGKVNKFFADKVDVIATSTEEVAGIEAKYQAKVQLTGNPVRSGIKAVRDLSYAELNPDGLMRILVTGGSQGASIFSKIVPLTITSLPEHLRKRIRIDQQCRVDDINEVRKIYNNAGVSADVSVFFSDMPNRLAAAHLVIARAGASSISELIITGRPSILVPLPFAAMDHQFYNAKILQDKNAAWLIKQDDFTVSKLKDLIESFLQNPSLLTNAAENAKALYNPALEGKLSNIVEELTI
jgi:UDP-N-acetylglucosamine--N-acetylmuramyl-(pentapeptide) pyrophosphoryl-undecaprenol N-acetylglucosamine transferase